MKTTTQPPSAERLAHDVAELKKLGANAVIENGGIIIKGDLLLYYEEEKSIGIDASIFDNIVGIDGMLFSNAREIQDDFMPRIKYVNGSIYFKKLVKVGNNFMQKFEGLYGCLNFDNLEKAGNNFMQNLVFIGIYPLFCRLEEVGNNFMQNLIGIGRKTYANGMLSLYALQRFSGVQEIKCKYYRKYGFAYFDEILSKVEKVSKVDDFQKWYYSFENDDKTFEVEVAEKYTIYSCMFGEYIARKGKYTARAETVERAINDLKRKLKQ